MEKFLCNKMHVIIWCGKIILLRSRQNRRRTQATAPNVRTFESIIIGRCYSVPEVFLSDCLLLIALVLFRAVLVVFYLPPSVSVHLCSFLSVPRFAGIVSYPVHITYPFSSLLRSSPSPPTLACATIFVVPLIQTSVLSHFCFRLALLFLG